MRINFGPKAILYPQPVLIIGTYDENGKANAMNAAWGGICDYDKVSIALASHKTTDNLLINKAFTISIGTTNMVEACDYVGLVSQNNVTNKLEIAGLNSVKSEFVNAPLFEELPLVLECEVYSYDENSEILIGKIINVSCKEEYLTNGKIDPHKIGIITYDSPNHNYIELGRVVGKAFECGKKLQK